MINRPNSTPHNSVIHSADATDLRKVRGNRKEVGEIAQALLEQLFPKLQAETASNDPQVIASEMPVDGHGKLIPVYPVGGTKVAIIIDPPQDAFELAKLLTAFGDNGVLTVVFEPRLENNSDCYEALNLATACVLGTQDLIDVTGEADFVMGLYAVGVMRGIASAMLSVVGEDHVCTALHRAEFHIDRPRVEFQVDAENDSLIMGTYVGVLAAAIGMSHQKGELLLPAAKLAGVAMSMAAVGQPPQTMEEIVQFDLANPWERLLKPETPRQSTRWGLATAVGLLLGTTFSTALSIAATVA